MARRSESSSNVGADRIGQRGEPKDRAILDIAEITVDPVAHVKGRALAVGTATVAFQEIVLHRTERVVIELRKAIVVLTEIREDAGRAERVGQVAARTVDPPRVGKPGRIGAAGPVHAKRAIGSIVAEQRLEHRSPPRPVQDGRGRAGEGARDGPVADGEDAVIAEEPPRQRYRRGMRKGGEQAPRVSRRLHGCSRIRRCRGKGSSPPPP